MSRRSAKAQVPGVSGGAVWAAPRGACFCCRTTERPTSQRRPPPPAPARRGPPLFFGRSEEHPVFHSIPGGSGSLRILVTVCNSPLLVVRFTVTGPTAKFAPASGIESLAAYLEWASQAIDCAMTVFGSVLSRRPPGFPSNFLARLWPHAKMSGESLENRAAQVIEPPFLARSGPERPPETEIIELWGRTSPSPT